MQTCVEQQAGAASSSADLLTDLKSGYLLGANPRKQFLAQLAGIFADVPSKELPRGRLSDPGVSIVDALIESGLCKNKSEARRIITQGGAYVNNRRVESIETWLTPADLASESMIVLRSGKKNYALLRFE